MKGLDTNLLVRLATRDDPVAAEAVRDFLIRRCSEDDPGFINRIVLCELVWVLRRVYRFPRGGIAAFLGLLFATPGLVIEDRVLADRALARFRAGRGDFADYLLAETNVAAGCTSTVTLDDAAAKENGFAPLESG